MRALAAGFTLILVSGCTMVREERGITLTAPEQTASSALTSHEVLNTLGPPIQIGALDSGYAFLYEHTVINERQLGLSVNTPLLRYFKFAIGSAEAERQVLILLFDHDGRLTQSGYREWTEDLGRGNSIQFIIAVMSVVDTGDLTESPASLTWGGGLLKSRLPESLNSSNSPLTGLSGVELRGTPTGAGQRTLEADTFPVIDLLSY
ncbi:MAG: hypothetical protein AB3N64_10095 [Puniceicoccaceae bacterium]